MRHKSDWFLLENRWNDTHYELDHFAGKWRVIVEQTAGDPVVLGEWSVSGPVESGDLLRP